MPSGIQGLAEGIMAGVQPGMVIGDRIAAMRANSAMQDIQNKLSSGAYPNSPDGQQQLQDDIRAAQQPLSARGLDPSYGSDQLQRMMNLQQLRGNQQAGALVDTTGGSSADGTAPAGGGAPNYAPALASQAGTDRMLGNLGGAMQADEMAGQINAGRSAVNNTGQVQPDGTLPGGVNQTQLATGTSANMANFGDNASAAQWGGQASQAADASVQGMLGRALTVGTNPQLGGMQAAAPYVHAAAQMMGYGNVQYSPSQNALSIQDQAGNQVALVTPQNLQQFASTIGNNPQQLLGQVRALQAQQYQDQRQTAIDTRKAGMQAGFDLAKSAPSDAMLNQAERAATQSQSVAERTGWKVLSTTDETDSSGAPTGAKKILVQPPGSEPLLMTVSQPDPNNPTQPAYRLQRQDGSDIPASQLPALQAKATSLAQAASDTAILNNLKLNRSRFQQGMANIQDVYNTFAPGAGGGQQPAPQQQSGAMGAQSGGQGVLPQGQTPGQAAPAAPSQQGNYGQVLNYQSKNPEFDQPQMMQESGGNPSAVSIKGAQGPMQLMPATARALEQQFGLPAGTTDGKDSIGVAANIQLGRQYRDSLIDKYSAVTKNPQLGKLIGLAAYNWGPSNVDKWLANGADPSKLPAETRQYVASIAGAAARNTGGGNSGSMAATPQVSSTPVVPRNALPSGPASKYLYKG